jgi:hypothetical protein
MGRLTTSIILNLRKSLPEDIYFWPSLEGKCVKRKLRQ